ncbi:MAG: hypothetical protein K0S65_5581 [Labilithrix sp.]|nr:hypothetical protein [Labilithrix sp.]
MSLEFKEGARVKITEGAFAGFTAKVLWDFGDDEVECEVDVFGRPTNVDIPRTHLVREPTAMTDAMLAEIESEVALAARMRCGHGYRRTIWLADHVKAGVRDEELVAFFDRFKAIDREVEDKVHLAEDEALARLHVALAPLSPEEKHAYWESTSDEWKSWRRPEDMTKALERTACAVLACMAAALAWAFSRR